MNTQKSNQAKKDYYGFDYIEVLGARTHNLKNINVSFPRNQLVIITGVSGSGKSSLAFDTINAEGQRRYRESFSTYGRRFLSNLTRPEVDKINGLSPVIAIDQKTSNRNLRSTVGTTTEVYDFIRLLFARIGQAYAYTTGNKMVTQDKEQILAHLLRNFFRKRVTLMAPVIRGRKGNHESLLKHLIKLGFNKVRVNGLVIELTEKLKLARHKKHDIALIIDHILLDIKELNRIKDGLTLAIQYGEGTLLVVVDGEQKDHYFSTHLTDEKTGLSYNTPEPNLFSFNSPYGACPTCDGLGEITQIDIDTIIPDKSISIQHGAIVPLGPYKTSLLFKKIGALLKFFQFQMSDPVNTLPLSILNLLLFGNIIKYRSILVSNFIEPFEGIINALIKQQEPEVDKYDSHVNEEFVNTIICPDCQGARLNPIARSFRIQNNTIADLVSMDLNQLKLWLNGLLKVLKDNEQIIAHEIIKEITKRLEFLINVGLHYLYLNRSLSSLSGGEAQRIRLATQIGTQLLGVLYILDEPSIGLHQRDNDRLISSLKALRDIGNTVLVVEHDKDMMLAADYLIEIGPQAGIHGGKVMAKGTLPEFLAQPSVTAQFLTKQKSFDFNRRTGNGKMLIIKGCTGNNLKNITLNIPLGTMICITGVSGSGKSSLIHKTLLPILKKSLYNSRITPLPYTEAIGLTYINKIIEINQSPIGRTPRSNLTTYTGMFTDIRNFFAILPEAKIRGYKPGRFSFNLKEGRCNTCEGVGIQRIEMGFLPEIYITCDNCKGKRYSRETLEIQYKSKSIADVLDMTVSNAMLFFESHPSILIKLKTLEEVRLGYITLGQHATMLSGGEAQRIKLATELSKKSTGNTLYILDEPSTGLHFQDIIALLAVLNKLVVQGNTVLVIEHNIDIIKVADYVIDIGPDSGQYGGYLTAQGTPEAVAMVPESYTGFFLKKELGL